MVLILRYNKGSFGVSKHWFVELIKHQDSVIQMVSSEVQQISNGHTLRLLT